MHITPWFLVLIYIIPLMGTLVAMIRRVQAVWSIGESLRKLLPVDRFSKKLMEWSDLVRAWRVRHPITNYINVAQLNYVAGTIEYAFGHLRDYTVGLYMMACTVVYLTLMVFGNDLHAARHFDRLFYHSFFALLSIWTYRRHVSTGLQMTEFMRTNPAVHPQEFFEHYYRRLGPASIPIPAKASRLVDPHTSSFKSGRARRQSYWLLLHACYDTAIFARSATKAMQTLGSQYGREVFDVMAQLWGKRMLQLFRAELKITGDELFKDLSGKIILVFNHKSHLDFVFNFFALSQARRADGRPILPRYMAAKDHFVDNRFVYEGIGVGKLIESIDMVFVDRKGKGKDAVAQAADRLAHKDIEIAMYPQGTRAFRNKDWEGRRLDAGYYTTGSRKALQGERGHLKKGAAFLALDTAIALRPQGLPVHLVFIGIDGTATIAPKQGLKIETEGSVHFNVNGVLTITPEEVEGFLKPEPGKPVGPATTEGPLAQGQLAQGERLYLERVDELQQVIDEQLVDALNLHERLKNRFLEDARARQFCSKEQVFSLAHRLQQARQNHEARPFIILDRIYALDPAYWESYLRRMTELLLGPNPYENGIELCDQVTEFLFATHGRPMQKNELNEQTRHRLKKTA